MQMLNAVNMTALYDFQSLLTNLLVRHAAGCGHTVQTYAIKDVSFVKTEWHFGLSVCVCLSVHPVIRNRYVT
jgi:hypothetical protein